jgi:hypothetical protein
MSSRPNHEVPSVLKRLTIAPEASSNSGSSFEITNRRQGRRPVVFPVLDVDREIVLARDRQQALYGYRAVAA